VSGDKKRRANSRLVVNSSLKVSEQGGIQAHRSFPDHVQESNQNSFFPVTCHRLPVTFSSLLQLWLVYGDRCHIVRKDINDFRALIWSTQMLLFVIRLRGIHRLVGRDQQLVERFAIGAECRRTDTDANPRMMFGANMERKGRDCMFNSFAQFFDLTIDGTPLIYNGQEVANSNGGVNPHTQITFTVTDDRGNIEKWVAEGPGPNRLANHGWSKDSLKPGDEITIVGNRNRDGSPTMRFEKVILPNGQELEARPHFF